MARASGRLVDHVHAVVRQALAPAVPGKILVAFSGGADSTCLLGAITSVAPQRIAAACCVDHGLRAEAKQEVVAAGRMAARLGVPFLTEVVDTPATMIETGAGAETAARNLRYHALRAAAERLGADLIALGHIADDQVETVLMHLFRGASINGMAGMASIDGDLFRPLLSLTHPQTVAYCRARDLDFVEDESNRDTSILRNRLRLELLPDIEAAFPGVREAVLRLAGSVKRDVEFLDEIAAEAVRHIARGEELSPELWAALPPSLRYRSLRMLRDMRERSVSDAGLSEDAEDLESRFESQALTALDVTLSQSRLPFAVVDAGALPVPLRVPGRTNVAGGVVDAALRRCPPELRAEALLSTADAAYLDRDKLGGLQVRAPRQDRRDLAPGRAGRAESAGCAGWSRGPGERANRHAGRHVQGRYRLGSGRRCRPIGPSDRRHVRGGAPEGLEVGGHQALIRCLLLAEAAGCSCPVDIISRGGFRTMAY